MNEYDFNKRKESFINLLNKLKNVIDGEDVFIVVYSLIALLSNTHNRFLSDIDLETQGENIKKIFVDYAKYMKN